MKVTSRIESNTTVAARIAGEDIASGDYIAVISEVLEFPSFFWNSAAVSLPPDEPVRVRYMTNEAGQPYKVLAVCLPFVYAESHCGSIVVMDTRKRQLVRLDRDCARTVWKHMKAASNKSVE